MWENAGNHQMVRATIEERIFEHQANESNKKSSEPPFVSVVIVC